MAVFTKDKINANGDREIVSTRTIFEVNTKDRGILRISITFKAICSALLQKHYEFNFNIESKGVDIDLFEGARLVIYDSKKNYCELVNIGEKDYPTYIGRDEGYCMAKNMTYSITEENVKKLDSLERTNNMRFETSTSFIDVTSLWKIGCYNFMISSFLSECIHQANEAMNNTSNNLFQF